jgi:acyl carrier protein
MSSDNIKTAVYELISEHFSVAKDEISDALGPGNLRNWDSIGHVQLVQKLEERFSISFDVHDIMAFNTVKDIYTTIEEYLSKKA